jgi:RNA polymerase sigma-70 factor (ECF subfamily)
MKLTPEQIKEFSQGNVKIFNEIYDSMFHSLCLFGYKMIPEEDVVSDVVQEVFISLWNKREQFTSPIKTRAYLYTSVRNNILTQIRDKHTVSLEENPQEEEIEFNNHIAAEETYRLIHYAVANLPLQTSKVIDLTINGYGNPEIADALNISVNTVKTLKKSGYSKLREQLKNNVFALLILADVLS